MALKFIVNVLRQVAKSRVWVGIGSGGEVGQLSVVIPFQTGNNSN